MKTESKSEDGQGDLSESTSTTTNADTKTYPLSMMGQRNVFQRTRYDLSIINGILFAAEGIIITPSMENDPNNPVLSVISGDNMMITTKSPKKSP